MKLSKQFPPLKFLSKGKGYYAGKQYADLHTMYIKHLEEKFVKAMSGSPATVLHISNSFFWDSVKYWNTLGHMPIDQGLYLLLQKTPNGNISYIVMVHEYELGKDVAVEIFKYVGGRVAGTIHYFSHQTVLSGALRGLSNDKVRNEVGCCLGPIAAFQYMPSEDIEKEDTSGEVKKMRCRYEKTNDTAFNVSFLTKAYFNRTGKKLHKVRSFPRKQRVGKGRKDIRIVWVKEHTRGKSV